MPKKNDNAAETDSAGDGARLAYDPAARLAIRIHDAKSCGDPRVSMPIEEAHTLADALRAAAPRPTCGLPHRDDGNGRCVKCGVLRGEWLNELDEDDEFNSGRI